MTPINFCEEDPCQNKGFCMNGETGPTCRCIKVMKLFSDVKKAVNILNVMLNAADTVLINNLKLFLWEQNSV